MSSDPLHIVLGELPARSMTTRLLSALDYLVPGEWQNITDFTEMVRNVTGEEDEGILQQVGERAIKLYNDPDNGYQRAVQIYRMVDDTGGLAGMAALANKVGEGFEWMSFLSTITPKADTTQAIDAGLKLVAEVAAFCYASGIPGDSVGDFAAALGGAAKEDAIRLSAWLACDCVLPLGPDFLEKILGVVSRISSDELGGHGRFARLTALLPGSGVDEQRELLQRSVDASSGAIMSFAQGKDFDQGSVMQRLQGALELADNRLDYVAAGIDLTTSYYEHTGIQSVARRLISRAYGEI